MARILQPIGQQKAAFRQFGARACVVTPGLLQLIGALRDLVAAALGVAINLPLVPVLLRLAGHAAWWLPLPLPEVHFGR